MRANAVVYQVPTDPKDYGGKDSTPIFDSLELPEIPLFLRFSPDDESLVMLCSSPTSTGTDQTSLTSMRWGKYAGKKAIGGQEAMARFAPRKIETLMTGKDLFFTYTTSSKQNSTIVAHCERSVKSTDATEEPVKAVWLHREGFEEPWSKISDSHPDDKWSTPVCHSAGGGDSVLVVEDGWLVSKSISRWKRDENGEMRSKKIMEVRGQVNFLVAPDNSRAVVLQEDIEAGHYRLTVIEGEDALDPSSSSSGVQYELPNSKLTVAFYFSPDSTKLLCLTAARHTLEDVMMQRARGNSFQVGINSDMQYSVFNFPMQELREYETFKPTPYFMKTYVAFSSQYAQVSHDMHIITYSPVRQYFLLLSLLYIAHHSSPLLHH